jgi:hypothetical protein
MIQGSDEWFLARAGKVTASNFSDVLAKGEGKTRKAYMLRVIGEILSGKPYEGFKNAHMERGNEHEPYARWAYEAETGNTIDEVGFIKHPTLEAGASPDGLIGDDGIVEIKNVIPSVQIETILSAKYPSTHKAQIQGNLWVTGRKWADFVSHCEYMKETKLRTYIFRVERNEEYITNLEKEVIKFINEMTEIVESLKKRAA